MPLSSSLCGEVGEGEVRTRTRRRRRVEGRREGVVPVAARNEVGEGEARTRTRTRTRRHRRRCRMWRVHASARCRWRCVTRWVRGGAIIVVIACGGST